MSDIVKHLHLKILISFMGTEISYEFFNGISNPLHNESAANFSPLNIYVHVQPWYKTFSDSDYHTEQRQYLKALIETQLITWYQTICITW